MRQRVKEGQVCLCAVEVEREMAGAEGIEGGRVEEVGCGCDGVAVVARYRGLDGLSAAAAATEERCRSDILDT